MENASYAVLVEDFFREPVPCGECGHVLHLDEMAVLHPDGVATCDLGCDDAYEGIAHVVGWEVVQLLPDEADDAGRVVFFRRERERAEKLRAASQGNAGKHPDVLYKVRPRLVARTAA